MPVRTGTRTSGEKCQVVVQSGLLHPPAGGSGIGGESVIECGPFRAGGLTGETTGDEHEHGVRGCLGFVAHGGIASERSDESPEIIATSDKEAGEDITARTVARDGIANAVKNKCVLGGHRNAEDIPAFGGGGKS